MEKIFQRNLSELDHVFRFLETNLGSRNDVDRNAFAIKFVVEELFTNMVKYGKGSEGDITIRFERNEGSCVVTMIDDDVEPFDVTNPPDVDIVQPLQERTPGGLGIYLVNKIVDAIDYRYADRQSIITFTKNMG